jgi:hypothetical protein
MGIVTDGAVVVVVVVVVAVAVVVVGVWALPASSSALLLAAAAACDAVLGRLPSCDRHSVTRSVTPSLLRHFLLF